MSSAGCGCGVRYKVIKLLGEGACGKVAKGRNLATKELVALKVHKKGPFADYFFEKELEMMGHISSLDPDTYNLTRFIEHFEYDGKKCLVFELLQQTAYEHINNSENLSLNQIRPMAKQLLVALFGLKGLGVMHTDIKPNNIMLVNQEKQPFKVKLIDFGVAKHCDQVRQGSTLQPVGLRSPEVILGLPLSEAVDMWSLACCLLIWFVLGNPFKCRSEFDQLTHMVSFLGQPSDELLNQAMYTNYYFVQEDSTWRLKTVEELKETTEEDPQMSRFVLEGRSLEWLIKETLYDSCTEFIDREDFHDLLKKMLEMDPVKRITPAEALLHPFITMEHLPHNEDYTREAHALMHVAQTDHLPLQTENLENVAEDEKKKRDEVLLSRPSAPPKPAPHVTKQVYPEEGEDDTYFNQTTSAATCRLGCCQEAEENAIDLEEEEAEAEEDNESQISEETEPAPNSTFGRFIPRALREFWSRLRTSTTTNRPVLRRPRWARLPPVFRRRSAGQQSSTA